MGLPFWESGAERSLGKGLGQSPRPPPTLRRHGDDAAALTCDCVSNDASLSLSHDE